MKKMMNVQSIFHTAGTEVREQEGLRKPGYINKGERVVVFDHVLPLCITQLIKVSQQTTQQ